jgi:YfiH family protein
MSDQFSASFKIYKQFYDYGFAAGITLKGPWANSLQMYDYIRNDLIPSDLELLVPEQVHGIDIVHITNNTNEIRFKADGVITDRSDICLSVTTADCLPLIMIDPLTGIFAAIHVGWRSFLGGILESVAQIAGRLNIEMNSTRFIVGPGINDCCFEVGPEVAALFDEPFILSADGVFRINLRGAVGNKLESLGVVRDNVEHIHECTSCESRLYYSYRRDKESPLQMVTFIHKLKQ